MEIDGNRYGSLGGVKYRAPYGAKNGITDVLDINGSVWIENTCHNKFKSRTSL